MSLVPGQILGKYRILEPLGEGGMGAVHHARDEMLDRDVAIKVLRPELVAREELVARFRTEAVALARLAHPRIATLYGLERDGNDFYMVMEYLNGETLEALAAREQRLPWRKAARICAAVAEALDHAHDHGVVHRDIKPANIMIGPGGSIKVMDFGIARMAGSSRQTKHGHTVGTPAYMAPEQLRGQETDGRTDLYSLGAVLYELVTGKVAFEADSDYHLMMQQLNEPPPRPSSVVHDLPSEIDGIVLTAMEKARDDRFPTAAAMRIALLDAADDPALASSAAASEIGGSVPETRHALAPPVNTGSLGSPAASHPTDSASAPKPLWLDWRTWSAATMMVVAAALLVRGGGEQAADPSKPVVTADSASISSIGTATITRRPLGSGIDRVPQPVRSAPIAPAEPEPQPPVSRDKPPTRRQSPPTPAPAPVPDPTPESPAKPATDPAADQQQAARAITAWLGRLSSRDPGGVTGSVNGQPLSKLVGDGRISVAERQTAEISLNGDRASATVRATLAVRSSFGAARKQSVQFRFTLARDGAGWKVRSIAVEG